MGATTVIDPLLLKLLLNSQECQKITKGKPIVCSNVGFESDDEVQDTLNPEVQQTAMDFLEDEKPVFHEKWKKFIKNMKQASFLAKKGDIISALEFFL